MTVAIYLPLLLAPVLAVAVRRMAGWGAPSTAVRGLIAVALVAAVSWTWSLLLLALTLLDDVPPLAALDDHAVLELPEPVPGPVGLAAAVLLAAGLLRLIRDAHRRVDTHRQLRAAGSRGGDLVVADWVEPMAVAVPGRPGYVLITTGLLEELEADERRVVFAHERSHLARRHHRLVAVVAGAAALNPLLIRVRDAVDYLVERWADEDAAAAVGDRELTAQAVAHAALVTVRQGPAATLGITGAAAVLRVRALGEPAPTPRRRRLVGPALIGLGCLAATAAATAEFVALARVWL